MERIIKREDVLRSGMAVSTLSHPSLTDSDPDKFYQLPTFYRGPILSTSVCPDNTYNFYSRIKYKSIRSFEPNLNGSL